MKLLFGCCCPPRVKEEEDGGVNMAERPTASTSLDSVAESRGSVTAVSSDAQRGSPITQEFALARAAVFNDDLRSLDKLVEDDPWLLNASDQFGRTLLIHAALTDRAKVVDWLIRRGSWIETTDRQGRSALHWAVKRNSIKTVRLLLAQKRHSSRSLFLIADADHVTPMHLACRLPSPKCLKIILQHIESDDDCAKMASDDGGRSPLHYAGAHGLSAHLNLLLNDDRLRFSVNQADCIGRTPIMYAVTAASPNAEECVRLLLRRSPLIVSAQDKRGLTPLHLAACSNNLGVMSVLLDEYDCQSETFDMYFRTALHWTGRLGLTEASEKLMSSGAKPDTRDSQGATPLHYAALFGHVDTLKALLINNGNKDAIDNEARTALMWAASARCLETVEAVLEVCADQVSKEGKDRNGSTALHFAAFQGALPVVELLLDRGYSLKATDLMGATPLLLAAGKGQTEVVRMLLSAGATRGERDLAGRTALHMACLGGQAYTTQTLIKEGFDVDAPDNGGRTPIHCAAFAGFIGCVSTLLQNGGNVAVEDNQGRTALHMAAERGHTNCAQLLLEWGAAVNALCYDRGEPSTPLSLALVNQHAELADVLVAWGAYTTEGLRETAAVLIQAWYRGTRVRRLIRLNHIDVGYVAHF